MSFKVLSVLGILVGVSCIGVATALYPGGYDWNRDFISTLLRGPSGPARPPAVAGVLLFCASIALVFARLSRAAEFARVSKVVQIAGIGSAVYSAFTVTPLHYLVVTISIAFDLVALLALLWALWGNRERGFFTVGCVCLVVLVAGVASYYTGVLFWVLPWVQRASFGLMAAWLVALDFAFPRRRLRQAEAA